MRARISSVLLGFGLVLLLGACGGNAEGNSGSESGGMANGGMPGATQGGSPGQAGATGAAQGGSSPAGKGGASGGAAGTPSSGGAPGRGGEMGFGGAASGGLGSGGQGVCCFALAVCDEGDTTLMGDACPSGADCYSRTICCSTVHCVRQRARCDAFPSCDAGDTQIMGACPPDAPCYTRTLCGNTVTCIDSSCDPATEYNRKYAAKGANKCDLIDFSCPANTQYFMNGCGCGCEQDAMCPEFVDCSPHVGGGTSSSLCSDKASCPYTTRAL